MALALPADLFESRAVAIGGGDGRRRAPARARSRSTYLIGVVADRFSFTPILITASVVPLAGGGARGARSSATPRSPGAASLKAI